VSLSLAQRQLGKNFRQRNPSDGVEETLKYQIYEHGWALGQWFVPPGSIIDDAFGKDRWSLLVKELGLFPPLNAQPLSQATYDAMKRAYPEFVHRIRTVPGADGIKR
jgi:hypothetical protein